VRLFSYNATILVIEIRRQNCTFKIAQNKTSRDKHVFTVGKDETIIAHIMSMFIVVIFVYLKRRQILNFEADSNFKNV